MLEKCAKHQYRGEGMRNNNPRFNQWIFQSFRSVCMGVHLSTRLGVDDNSTTWPQFHGELLLVVLHIELMFFFALTHRL